MRINRRLFGKSLWACAVASFGWRRASAQFFNIGGATEWTQLLNYAQLVGISAKQIQHVTTAIQTYQQIVQAGRLLTGMQWRDASSDLMNIAAIASNGQAMSFALRNLDQQFRTTYPGYTRTIPRGSQNFAAQYEQWATVALDTIRGSLNGSSLSYSQLQNEQAYHQYLRNQAGSVQGQAQALQVGNQVGMATLDSLGKLREVILTNQQSVQVYQAAQLQEKIDSHLKEQNFFADVPVPKQ
jgi:P-type conjugative transfer protein TrbJ